MLLDNAGNEKVISINDAKEENDLTKVESGIEFEIPKATDFDEVPLPPRATKPDEPESGSPIGPIIGVAAVVIAVGAVAYYMKKRK
jgi:hypothetical protein